MSEARECGHDEIQKKNKKRSVTEPLNQQKSTEVPAIDLHMCEWHTSHYQRVHKQFLWLPGHSIVTGIIVT